MPSAATIPLLKERLHLNVELASPDQFIPIPDGWPERGRFIKTVGRMTFLHYAKAMEYFVRIEPFLYRFPAVDPLTFRSGVEAMFGP